MPNGSLVHVPHHCMQRHLQLAVGCNGMSVLLVCMCSSAGLARVRAAGTSRDVLVQQPLPHPLHDEVNSPATSCSGQRDPCKIMRPRSCNRLSFFQKLAADIIALTAPAVHSSYYVFQETHVD